MDGSVSIGCDLPLSPIVAREGLSFIELSLVALPIGADYVVIASGGHEHVGCAVLAIPRPSLSDDNTVSSTASVLNVSGHKDDIVCRIVAERMCAALRATVVCTGGVHVDGISAEQITQVVDAFERMADRLTEKLAPDC